MCFSRLTGSRYAVISFVNYEEHEEHTSHHEEHEDHEGKPWVGKYLECSIT